jgi:hypothetical protein
LPKDNLWDEIKSKAKSGAKMQKFNPGVKLKAKLDGDSALQASSTTVASEHTPVNFLSTPMQTFSNKT